MSDSPLIRPRVAPTMNDSEFQQAEELFGSDPNVIKAQDGIEMRAFWNSRAGKLLEQRAIEQKDDGLVDMLQLDPQDDIKEWRKAKLKVLISEQLLIWVGEILQEGEIAIEALAEEHDKMDDYRTTH